MRAFEIDYSDTNYFSPIINAYLKQDLFLRDFYKHDVSLEGFEQAIKARQGFSTDRELLVGELKKQYEALPLAEIVSKNIDALKEENTFTVCTAHQPNIFTGHLYFIYKILHTIKLTSWLDQQFPGKKFVPVFYMGSEDADLEELGQFYLYGEKYIWKTKQTGAVGRMKVDADLLSLIDSIESRIIVEPYGKEVVELLRNAYVKDSPIDESTFRLVHALFSKYGLIVLLPDNCSLKSGMKKIFSDDLFEHNPAEIVNSSVIKLEKNFKVQAYPRDINLFYLEGNRRERIIKTRSGFALHETHRKFTEEELKNELNDHPQRFSPNVILRGLFQETILPNIAFIGGGGELAYWLELKNLFEHYQIPFPILILRNSFMLVSAEQENKITKLGFDLKQFFQPSHLLLKDFILRHSQLKLSLDEEKKNASQLFDSIRDTALKVDPTLERHARALSHRLEKQLEGVEKKMLRAEKEKHEAATRQVSNLKSQLFPANSLQERVENFIPYYAKLGEKFLEDIYNNTSPLNQKFTILTLDLRPV